MKIVAHRGYGEAYPENTRLAFRKAAESADWIELDVRACATDELVVFHDETLDRLTNTTGTVAASTWTELQELEVDGSDQKIPSLREALSTIPAETGVQIELKEAGLAARALSIAAEFPHATRFISFSPLILNQVNQNSEKAETGLILHPELFKDDPRLGLDLATHLGSSTVHVYRKTVECSEQPVISLAKEFGLDVQMGLDYASKGHRRDSLEEYDTIGIDYVSVDEPVSKEWISSDS